MLICQCKEMHRRDEDYVRDTVTAIKDMDIDYVIPLLHCTGEPFYETAKAEYRTNSCAPIPAHASSSAPDRTEAPPRNTARPRRRGDRMM
jgi:hypothetical protein